MSPKRGHSVEYILSESQIKDSLVACQDLKDRVIFKAQVFCGLRERELMHLNESWIRQDGNIKIPSQMKCNCSLCINHPKHPGEWRPKTTAGARTVSVPKRMREDLTELLRIQPYGLGLSRISIYNRTKAILERARVKFPGLAKNTSFPHALRATAATICAAEGMTEFELCYYFGWSDINQAKPYVKMARTMPKALQKAREIFG